MRELGSRVVWVLRCWSVVFLVTGALSGFASPAAAQAAAQETGVELSPAVRLSLQKLQEQWLQWVAAFYRDDRTAAANAEREMSGVAVQLGMGRLPDLALAMTARGVEAAGEGKRERAGWALAAAEALDPGRPEIAFGGARAAWSSGRYLDSVAWYGRGVERFLASRSDRPLLLRGAALWLATAGLVVGALFVIVQIGVKGPTLYRDVFALCRRGFAPATSHLVTVLALTWPLALPGGVALFFLWASVLAWGHSSSSERGAIVGVWLIAGLAPVLAARQNTELGLLLSPPLRAMQGLEDGRLYGTIFGDLGVLRGVLPESAAVKHLTADVHRRLGQWDYAKALYSQVVESEPDNVDALLSVGSYHFTKGDFATAARYYKRAATLEPPSAAAYYDLSLAHSEAYQFDESRQALAQARRIDDERVTAWVNQAAPERVVTFEGGLRRRAEIRDQLAAAWRKDGPTRVHGEGARQWVSVFLAALAAILAFGWDLALRRFGGGEPVPFGSSRPSWVETMLAALLPAWRYSEDGDGGRALASLAGPVFVLLLPLGGLATVMPPAGLAAPSGALWVVAVLLLASILVVRLRRRAAGRG